MEMCIHFFLTQMRNKCSFELLQSVIGQIRLI